MTEDNQNDSPPPPPAPEAQPAASVNGPVQAYSSEDMIFESANDPKPAKQ